MSQPDLDAILTPGLYRVRDYIAPNDPELPHGVLEVYVHPEKGLCFWDDGVDGDSDGHISVSFLRGEQVVRLSSQEVAAIRCSDKRKP